MTVTCIFRVHSKTQFSFLFSFCLAKKKQKPNPPTGGQLLFFIPQIVCAAPPKKSQFALFRQKQPHYYQRMIDLLLNDASLFIFFLQKPCR